MPITVVFDPPLPSDSPEVFNSKAFSTLGDLNDWSTQANAVADQINDAQPNVDIVAGNIANINAAVADLPALSAKVSKTGDTMTGPLSVPASASGAQVPQAQEVLLKSGNLSGIANTATARSNLGLGSAATRTALGSSGSLYSRDSILGTVSQSSGVPTGAIIETGSNANGTYIRWADGTQICTRAFATVASGTTWTFPAVFSAAAVTVAVETDSVSANRYYMASTGTTTTFVRARNPELGNYTDGNCAAIAIGRWF